MKDDHRSGYSTAMSGRSVLEELEAMHTRIDGGSSTCRTGLVARLDLLITLLRRALQELTFPCGKEPGLMS